MRLADVSPSARMMPFREERAPVWAIWLLIVFSAAPAMLWALGVAHSPLVLVPLVLLWIALVVFAAAATRSITRLWTRLDQKEEAHTATLTASGPIDRCTGLLILSEG